MCHAEAAPYQKWPNSSQAKAAAPTGSPILQQLLLGGFLLGRERERDLCAERGKLAREAEEEIEEEEKEEEESLKLWRNLRKAKKISQFAFIRFLPAAHFTFAVADCVTRDSLQPENRRESMVNLQLVSLNPNRAN